jgi:hypothetical protein
MQAQEEPQLNLWILCDIYGEAKTVARCRNILSEPKPVPIALCSSGSGLYFQLCSFLTKQFPATYNGFKKFNKADCGAVERR